MIGQVCLFAAGAVRLMFGPEDAPEAMRTFAGFEYVTSSNAMLSGGATAPWRAMDNSNAAVYAHLNAGGLPADTLLEHGILCTKKAKLAVPFADGPCRVHVWVGDWFRGWNRLIEVAALEKRPDLMMNARTNNTIRLTANGRAVCEIPLTTDNVYAEWCKLEDYVFSKKDSAWDRLVKPVLTEYDFDAVAENGTVVLTMENILLTAVAVAKDGTEMAALLADVERHRRSEFAKRYPWEPQPDEPMPAAAKRGGKCLVFRKGVSDVVHPWTRPRDDEVTGEVFSFAAQGEQQALRIGFLPLEDLEDVEVSVGDFTCGGDTLSVKDNADFWRERYKETGSVRQNGRINSISELNPISNVLQTPKKVDWEAGTPRMYVLDLHLPARLRPGDWIAPVTVTSRGRTVAAAHYRVKVMPFSFEDSAATAATYGFQNAYGGALWASGAPIKSRPDEVMRARGEYYEFIARYGFSNFHLYPLGNKFLTFEGELGKTRVYQTEEDRKMMAWLRDKVDPYRREPYFALHLRRVFSWWGWKGADLDMFRGRRKPTPEQLEKWEASLKEVGRLAKDVERIFRENGWPRIWYYIGGEFDNHGRLCIEQAIRLIRELKKHGLDVLTVTNGPLAYELLPSEADHVWANPATPITEEFVDRIRAAGHAFGSHNCGDSRFMTGLHFWRIGSEGRYQETVFYTQFLWPYCLLPWNYTVALVLPTPEGHLRPTLNFLAYRDAKNDYLYLHALDHAIAKAPAGSPVRREAERFTSELKERVSFDPRCYFAERVRSLEGGQLMAETDWNEFSLSRMRWRAATLLEKFAAGDATDAYEVHLPCRGGELETYFLDLDAVKADAKTIRLTAPDGTPVPYSLDARIAIPKKASEASIAPDGGISHEKAPAAEDRFRRFGWFSFRAPKDARDCTLSFRGNAKERIVSSGDPAIRPWWIAAVKAGRGERLGNGWWGVATNGLTDVTRAGGRNLFAWTRLSAPDLEDGRKQEARFWSELDIHGYYNKAPKCMGYMELVDSRPVDCCCACRVRDEPQVKASARGSKHTYLVLPYELKSIAVEGMQLEFPPESVFSGLRPVSDQLLQGDELRYRALPDPKRETLVAFEDGGVRGERVIVPGGDYSAKSTLSDLGGSVVKAWEGMSVTLDGVAPGVYSLDSVLSSGGHALMRTRHEIRILKQPK